MKAFRPFQIILKDVFFDLSLRDPPRFVIFYEATLVSGMSVQKFDIDAYFRDHHQVLVQEV